MGPRLTLSSQTDQQERLVFFKPPKTAHNFSLLGDYFKTNNRTGNERGGAGESPARGEVQQTASGGFEIGSKKHKLSARTKWQKRVVRIKENVTIAPSYEDLYEKSPHLTPNDFSGYLHLGNLALRWRSVKAFPQRYLAISGKPEDTRWNLLTFCLQLPAGINEENEKKMLQRAGRMYATSYHAIRCAIFERCQEEVNGVNNNHNGNGRASLS